MTRDEFKELYNGLLRHYFEYIMEAVFDKVPEDICTGTQDAWLKTLEPVSQGEAVAVITAIGTGQIDRVGPWGDLPIQIRREVMKRRNAAAAAEQAEVERAKYSRHTKPAESAAREPWDSVKLFHELVRKMHPNAEGAKSNAKVSDPSAHGR